MKNLFVLISIGLCTGLALPRSAPAAKVFVLAVADTADDGIGRAAEENLGMVRALFRAGVAPELLAYRELTGEKLTADNLLAAIAKCPVTRDDCLVVWYSGRGVDREGEKYLALPDAVVFRSAVVDAVKATPAGRKVLVTDRCGQLLDSGSLRHAGEVPIPRRITPAFRRLLLEGNGLIELDSADSDKPGVYLSGCGGLLTLALAYPPEEHLCRTGPDGTRDNAATVTLPGTGRTIGRLLPRAGALWAVSDDGQAGSEPVVQTSLATQRRYRGDVTGKPTSGPVAQDPPGASGELPDTPERISMNFNNILLAIGGRKVRSAADVREAAARAAEGSTPVSLTFVENATGLVFECSAHLRPGEFESFSFRAIPGLGVLVTDIDDPDALVDLKVVSCRTLAGREVPFGIAGKFVSIRGHSMALPETPYGLRVESVTKDSPADRLGLEPGDIVLVVGDVRFSDSEGYRYALSTSPLLTDVVYIDAQSREMDHGQVLFPHKVAEPSDELPDGCTWISITPVEAAD